MRLGTGNCGHRQVMSTTSPSIVSRRSAAAWAADGPPGAPLIDVLIPTAGRIAELAVTLAGLAAQDDPPFRVIVSEQSVHGDPFCEPAVQAMLRLLRAQGREVVTLSHPRRGLAEHRDFLLCQADATSVLFLDDDVWLEPGTLQRMQEALRELDCGFVGSAVQGLSYLDDRRPHETASFEPWDGPPTPERVRPGTPAHDRWRLHNAANLAHLAAELGVGDAKPIAYRVAWIGGCVLYDRASLLEAGGFEFWRDIPERHAGEDVVAQWRVMERRGGAGLLPSGAVHLESPTTITDRGFDAQYEVADRTDLAPTGAGEKEITMADASPIEVQRHLGGVDYPAGKDEIVANAESSGAPDEVLGKLRALPDRRFDGPTDVSGAIDF